jgi:YjbE family integral membrane protein
MDSTLQAFWNVLEQSIGMDVTTPAFWIAVAQIIAIDILLGGDNAVVIALASRRLPQEQRRQAIFWGIFGAVAIRVVLIFFALQMLRIPFLKIAGGVLLFWIGVKLLLPQHEDDGREIDASAHLLGAVRTIVVADAVMSIDNVIGIAAAAKDNVGLVVFGLLVSVPIIVWGSRFVLRLMDRFPVVITAGAALLGWIAGDMIVHDVLLKDRVAAVVPLLTYVAPVLGAALVVVVGRLAARRPAAAAPAGPVDLAHSPDQGEQDADAADRR